MSWFKSTEIELRLDLDKLIIKPFQGRDTNPRPRDRNSGTVPLGHLVHWLLHTNANSVCHPSGVG